jgi:hypothetical protein
LFPNASISGCLFHLGQSIFRKIQKLGLTSVYHSNLTFKKFIKALIALSYVQTIYIEEKFQNLKNDINFPNLAEPVLIIFMIIIIA